MFDPLLWFYFLMFFEAVKNFKNYGSFTVDNLQGTQSSFNGG